MRVQEPAGSDAAIRGEGARREGYHDPADHKSDGRTFRMIRGDRFLGDPRREQGAVVQIQIRVDGLDISAFSASRRASI